MHVADVTGNTLKKAIRDNVDRRARIMTDDAPNYRGIGREFEGGHETVKHSAGGYVRGDVTTHTVEGYFSIVKPGINGNYHSVSKNHLHRNLAEYEFRYNGRKPTDGERTVAAIQAADGKRLRYKEPAAERGNAAPLQLKPI